MSSNSPSPSTRPARLPPVCDSGDSPPAAVDGAVQQFPRLEPWSIRAAQLDLARQMETVDRVIEFARFAHDQGFNTLFLCLEGRIKTPGFSDRRNDESYSLADMRRIVDACASWGMDVVPCVSTLGHVEQFLACEPRKAMANDAVGDEAGSNVFDTAIPVVYRFLKTYLHEVAAVFPSGHSHIGCDEAWATGHSTGERQRREAGASYADLFIDHVSRVRDILADLGKRTWIWDDMLCYFTDEQVARVPRDVVLCSWHYQGDQIEMDGALGHFDNLHRRDWLKLYDELGFDVLLALAVGFASSIEPIARWAQGHHVASGLLTS